MPTECGMECFIMNGFLFLSFLICQGGAVVPLLAEIVPNDVESVNGSRIDMGCATPLNYVGDLQCCAWNNDSGSHSLSYLSDGITPEIHTDRPDWASQLLTVRKNPGNRLVTFQHVVLTFGFEMPLTPYAVELEMFLCPQWNIGAPLITVYADNNPDMVFQEKYESYFFAQWTPSETSCDHLTTVQMPLRSNQLSYQYWHLLISFERQPSFEWVHVGEVRFIEVMIDHSSSIAPPSFIQKIQPSASTTSPTFTHGISNTPLPTPPLQGASRTHMASLPHASVTSASSVGQTISAGTTTESAAPTSISTVSSGKSIVASAPTYWSLIKTTVTKTRSGKLGTPSTSASRTITEATPTSVPQSKTTVKVSTTTETPKPTTSFLTIAEATVSTSKLTSIPQTTATPTVSGLFTSVSTEVTPTNIPQSTPTVKTLSVSTIAETTTVTNTLSSIPGTTAIPTASDPKATQTVAPTNLHQPANVQNSSVLFQSSHSIMNGETPQPTLLSKNDQSSTAVTVSSITSAIGLSVSSTATAKPTSMLQPVTRKSSTTTFPLAGPRSIDHQRSTIVTVVPSTTTKIDSTASKTEVPNIPNLHSKLHPVEDQSSTSIPSDITSSASNVKVTASTSPPHLSTVDSIAIADTITTTRENSHPKGSPTPENSKFAAEDKGLPILLILVASGIFALAVLILFGFIVVGYLFERHYRSKRASKRQYTQQPFVINPIYQPKGSDDITQDAVEGSVLVFNLYKGINPDTLSLHSSLVQEERESGSLSSSTSVQCLDP